MSPTNPFILTLSSLPIADGVTAHSIVAVKGAGPTAIAYAQLAGFPPVVGLYASILPLVAYAVFGTSRQLIVNPRSSRPADAVLGRVEDVPGFHNGARHEGATTIPGLVLWD